MTSLSFHDWERYMREQEQQYDEAVGLETSDQKNLDILQISSEQSKQTSRDTGFSITPEDHRSTATTPSTAVMTRGTSPELSETLENIRKLCRVCSNNGLISIHTLIVRANLKIKPWGDKSLWQVPIKQIIQDVSGEKVSQDDLLPQFICEHCLGYLQHAYEMRIKIRSNAASLRAVQEIANNESLMLERSQIDQTRITRREVNETNEDVIEERHFYNQFQGANIKINASNTARVGRVIEQKCPSCQKRMMSVKSLNEHMAVCEISIIDTFFSGFKQIYSMRLDTQLTTHEFILHAIKLVFDTQKKLQKIVKAKNLDVNAITSQLPPVAVANQPPMPNYYKRFHPSPDIGYVSDEKLKFTPR